MMTKRTASLLCPLLLAVFPDCPSNGRKRRSKSISGTCSTIPSTMPSLPTEQRIDNLLSLMTIDEKIDCLGTKYRRAASGRTEYRKLRGHSRSSAARGQLGRQPITTTQFPQPPGMGESWDPDLVRQAAGRRRL